MQSENSNCLRANILLLLNIVFKIEKCKLKICKHFNLTSSQ